MIDLLRSIANPRTGIGILIGIGLVIWLEVDSANAIAVILLSSIILANAVSLVLRVLGKRHK